MHKKKSDIKKAVFPVAGLGTRFLPATKASPKEMLTIVDKPLIQYAVEEAVSSGIDVLIFIIGRNKEQITKHFDRAYELENELKLKNKKKELEQIEKILPKNVQCIYIRQKEALGLGHAVLCSEPAVEDDPFAVILADDLIHTKGDSCLTQMCSKYQELQRSIISVEEVDKSNIHKYGVIDGEKINSKDWLLNSIIEKPSIDKAPSNMGVVGRYIFSPSIFDYLKKTEPGSGNEIQLTDAIYKQIKNEEVYAYQFNGTRYDCGTKIGFLKATMQYGLSHPELSDEFSDYLKKI
ncbi:MAG: UTP--glucose-1-phosphate uridylyltransferase [Gammaproteobacteria bacterium]|nr:UTP--glucose-1-phosphate uridylyltransferase [Gammaproteobacteria bacterium]